MSLLHVILNAFLGLDVLGCQTSAALENWDSSEGLPVVAAFSPR